MSQEAKLNELLGRTIVRIIGEPGDSSIELGLLDGSRYEFVHHQDCCEIVYLEDICGDMNDLIGAPILQAEEVSNEPEPDSLGGECEEWTFYKLATILGSVTLRWYGTSNGYYSTSVSFKKIN